MRVFFVVIGSTAATTNLLKETPALIVFIALQLSIHIVVAVGVGVLLRIPLPMLLVASNANVGGPSTALALVTSRGWDHLAGTAVVLGALGYSLGTLIGKAVLQLM